MLTDRCASCNVSINTDDAEQFSLEHLYLCRECSKLIGPADVPYDEPTEDGC